MTSTARTRWPRRALVVAGTVVGGLLLLASVWVGWTYRSADQAIERRTVDALEAPDVPEPPEPDPTGLSGHLNVLVVGNDTREGLTEEERAELTMGSVPGENTDTILVVQLRPEDEAVSSLSIPRDLMIDHEEHGRQRINALWALGGPDALVQAVEDLLGVEFDHYVELSVSSFVDIVDAIGHVEICLSEPLRDEQSGADFDAGCREMDGRDALAYVRSREGERGDFERVERQQEFLRALAERTAEADVLLRPDRLSQFVTTTAGTLTVDEELTTTTLLGIATAFRGAVSADALDTFTLPATPAVKGGAHYVVGYDPAVEALGERLAAAEPLPPSTAGDDPRVTVVPGHDPEAVDTIASVLRHAGLSPDLASPERALDEVDVTTVFAADLASRTARRAAAMLAAELSPLPDDWPEDDGVVVVQAADQP